MDPCHCFLLPRKKEEALALGSCWLLAKQASEASHTTPKGREQFDDTSKKATEYQSQKQQVAGFVSTVTRTNAVPRSEEKGDYCVLVNGGWAGSGIFPVSARKSNHEKKQHSGMAVTGGEPTPPFAGTYQYYSCSRLLLFLTSLSGGK